MGRNNIIILIECKRKITARIKTKRVLKWIEFKAVSMEWGYIKEIKRFKESEVREHYLLQKEIVRKRLKDVIEKGNEILKYDHINWRKYSEFFSIADESCLYIPSFTTRLFFLSNEWKRSESSEWDCVVKDDCDYCFIINEIKPKWMVIASIHY